MTSGGKRNMILQNDNGNTTGESWKQGRNFKEHSKAKKQSESEFLKYIEEGNVKPKILHFTLT